VTSSQNSEQIINSSIPLKSFHNNDDLQLNIINDHDYFPSDIHTITEFSKQIIVYIAGFVVRHLKKSLYCEECVNALTKDERDINSILIQIKSRGNLQYPSSSVIKICYEAEKVIRFALAESGGKFILKKYTEAYLINYLLVKFTESNYLFLNLKEHSHDQNFLENHIIHLTKALLVNI